MLRRVGSSASSVICRSFLSKPLIEASYASMHNNPLSNYMNEDGMVPIINESNIGSRSTKISIQYVNPEDAPKTDAEMFTTKDYPEDYFTAPVVNWDREFQSTVSLPKDIFGEVLRTDIIHRCVLHRVYQRRSQDGVKPTKTVTTISGSGRKPRPQKGSGRARLGKVRAAQMIVVQRLMVKLLEISLGIYQVKYYDLECVQL